MPAVDVDVTTIPDMIEAQLTLSYSRLAHLVRLIVDQGNGHDVDIDKLTNRIDALSKENAELRGLVESFMSGKSRESWVQTELGQLRSEISRVSDACMENAKNVASTSEYIELRLSDVDQRLSAESTTRAKEVDQIHTKIGEVQKLIHDMGMSLSHLKSFVEVWEGIPEKTETLTRRDAEGVFEHSTEERVKYLRSLPVFTNIFEELDVLRSMLRQQASDALSAKNAAGAIRRASAVEAAAAAASNGPSANDVDRNTIDNLQSSLDAVLYRVRELEIRRIPALEQAQRRQQQNQYQENQNQQQLQQYTVSSDEKEERERFENRLRHVENRLRNLSFKASDGSTLEKSLLADIESRLRLIEEVIDNLPLGKLSQEQRQGPHDEEDLRLPAMSSDRISSGQTHPDSQNPAFGYPVRRVPAPSETSEPSYLPYLSTGPMGGRRDSLNGRAAEGNEQHALRNGGRSQSDQFRSDTSRPHSTTPPLTSLQSQVAAGHSDGIQSRISQLEEAMSILEMKKADRQELAQLDDALRQILQNPFLLQSSTLARGVVPHRPRSQQDARGMNAMESECRSGAESIPRSAPPGRPLFIGGGSQYLRDSSGGLTSATVSSTHTV